MKKFTFIILACSLLALSCKTKKVVTDKEGGSKELTGSFLMKKLITNQVNTDFMTGKIKLNAKSKDLPGGAMSFSGTIRMEKDKAIWLSVKKFGFEAARILIEPDSVFVNMRMFGDNIREDLGYVQRKLNFPANFEMLQSIMLGNPVFFTREFEAKADSTSYQLYSETSSPRSQYVIKSADFLIEKMVFEESNPTRKMEINQANYQSTEGVGNFPYFRNYEMNSQETGDVNLKIEFSSAEFGKAAKMPFKK